MIYGNRLMEWRMNHRTILGAVSIKPEEVMIGTAMIGQTYFGCAPYLCV